MGNPWFTKLYPRAKSAFDNLPYNAVAYWPFVRRDGSTGVQSRVKVWDGAMVVALDHNSHEVYVVEQMRQTPLGPIKTIELPGGGVDPGDSPLLTAKKEVEEEAGVVALNGDADWVRIGPEGGLRPINGLIITEQHGFLLLRGKKVRTPTDEDTTGVTTKALSYLIEFDNKNGFHDPLSPYLLRRAHDWLKVHQPEYIT